MWFKYSPKKHLVTFFLQEDIEIPIPEYFIKENLRILQEREEYLDEILLNAGLLKQVNVPPTHISYLICLVYSHMCLNTRHWSEKCFYSSEEVKVCLQIRHKQKETLDFPVKQYPVRSQVWVRLKWFYSAFCVWQCQKEQHFGQISALFV